MKSLVLCLTVGVLLASCSVFEKALPKAKEVVAEKISLSIAERAQCENIEEIKKDVRDFLRLEQSDALVEAIQGGVEGQEVASFSASSIASPICEAAAKSMIPFLLEKATPSNWGCSVQNLKAKISEIAVSACAKI